MAYLLAVFSSVFFAISLSHVTRFRAAHPEAFWLIPFLVLFVWWDRRRPDDVLSSREEVRALAQARPGAENRIPRPTTWAAGLKQVFFTLIAHAAGASIGREAVGIQMGAWAARLREKESWYFSICLATGFSVVLGTPWAASVFVIESMKSRPKVFDLASLCFLVWLADKIAGHLGVQHVFDISFAASASGLLSAGVAKLVLSALVLSFLATGLGFLFQFLVFKIHEVCRRPKLGTFLILSYFVSVAGLFIFLGGPKVESLGLSGLGTQVLPSLVDFDFQLLSENRHPIVIALIKVLLTAGFVGFGLRGGEMTPLLVSGSLLAVGVGVLFGLPTAGLAAIGFPLVWGISARRPFTAAVLAGELFGFAPWGASAVIVFAIVSLSLWVGDRAAGTGRLWRRGLYD